MSGFTGAVLVVGLGLVLASCGGVGKPVGGDAPYHHLENGFRNPPNSLKRGVPFMRRLQFFSQAVWRNAFGAKPEIPEGHVLPRDTALQQLADMGDEDFVSWIYKFVFSDQVIFTHHDTMFDLNQLLAVYRVVFFFVRYHS